MLVESAKNHKIFFIASALVSLLMLRSCGVDDDDGSSASLIILYQLQELFKSSIINILYPFLGSCLDRKKTYL